MALEISGLWQQEHQATCSHLGESESRGLGLEPRLASGGLSNRPEHGKHSADRFFPFPLSSPLLKEMLDFIPKASP